MSEPTSKGKLILAAAAIYPPLLGFLTAQWAVRPEGDSWLDRVLPITAGYVATFLILLGIETLAAALVGAGQRREGKRRRRAAADQQRCGKQWGHFAHYWNASPVARYWCDGERSEET